MKVAIIGSGVAAAFAVLLVAAPVAAQTVAFPKAITFSASSDHTATDPVTGGPKVQSYSLNVVAVNPAGVIGFSQGLGKPTPDGTNTIGPVTIPGFLTLQPGAVYTATVSAIGPGGSAASPTSVPFGVPAAPTAPGAPIPK